MLYFPDSDQIAPREVQSRKQVLRAAGWFVAAKAFANAPVGSGDHWPGTTYDKQQRPVLLLASS